MQAYAEARIRVANNAMSFGEAFEQGGFDVVISASRLAWTDGLQVLQAVKERWPRTPLIMLARAEDEGLAIEAMKQGLDDFLVKSSKSFVSLPMVVGQALERAAARQSEARLETRLQTLLDQSGVGIFRATLDGQLLEVNPAFLRLFGKDSLVDASSLDLRAFLIPGAEGGDPISRFDEQGHLEREVEIQLPNGSTRWVSSTQMILLDGEGDLVIDGLVQDISELKQSQRSLERRAEQLGESNIGLKRFAALASHELREPLRMIEKYTRLLAEEYGSRLDPEAGEYLSFALDGAQRLQRMLTDLLTFSQVEVTSASFERVSCQEVVEKVLRDLEGRIREANAVVTVEPLPTVLGDRSQLELLFKNLVENAVKFHGDQLPRVTVSALQQQDDWLFVVSDNGLGFDAPGDELFKVFGRLRPEIPGSGIGLSICKRVVEYHGGRIWAESRPGRGSTFRFTIPLGRGRSVPRPLERLGGSLRGR